MTSDIIEMYISMPVYNPDGRIIIRPGIVYHYHSFDEVEDGVFRLTKGWPKASINKDILVFANDKARRVVVRRYLKKHWNLFPKLTEVENGNTY